MAEVGGSGVLPAFRDGKGIAQYIVFENIRNRSLPVLSPRRRDSCSASQPSFPLATPATDGTATSVRRENASSRVEAPPRFSIRALKIGTASLDYRSCIINDQKNHYRSAFGLRVASGSKEQ